MEDLLVPSLIMMITYKLVGNILSTLTPLGELEDKLMVLGVVDTSMEELPLLEFTMPHYLEHK